MDEDQLPALEHEILKAGASEGVPGNVRRRMLAALGLMVLLQPAIRSGFGKLGFRGKGNRSKIHTTQKCPIEWSVSSPVRTKEIKR